MSRPWSASTPDTDGEQAGTITRRDLDPPLEPRRAASTEHPRAVARRQWLHERGLPRDVGPLLREKVRTRRVPDPVGDVLVVADDAQRLGPAALDQVPRLETGHVGLVQEVHHEACAARRDARAPMASDHRAPASAGRAHALARVARGGSRSGTHALPRARRACAPPPRSSPESPTSNAISCSAAAPRSSRCTMRRASCDG